MTIVAQPRDKLNSHSSDAKPYPTGLTPANITASSAQQAPAWDAFSMALFAADLGGYLVAVHEDGA